MCAIRTMRAAMLWTALCTAMAFLGLERALAAAVEVDARTAHHAVWRVYGAGKTGTAIGDHYFVTCAHVIKDFAGHGAKEVLLNRQGSNDNRTLRVNHDHVALALAQDVALLTTKEIVDHYFALATGDAVEGETALRAMGHPRGRAPESMHQTAPIAFQDEVWYEIPVDREVVGGGFSDGPFFDTQGKVVTMLTHAGGNLVAAVKFEVIRSFLEGDLHWTPGRNDPSVAACMQRATTQARDLAEADDRVAQ